MPMWKLLKAPDFLTMGNLISGLMAIFAIHEGRYNEAAWLILVAMGLDALDGRVAIWLNQQNLLGKQLDSLADLVSFGVAPAFLFYALSGDLGSGGRSLIAALFVTAGMLRLARYNISNTEGFEGIPITVNGVLFPALMFLAEQNPKSIDVWPFVLLLQSFLMVSSIRVSRIF